MIILNPFRRRQPDTLWCDTLHPWHTPLPGQLGKWGGEKCNGALELMGDATYTLCPGGDAPDSPRLYSALARGSVPLVEPSTRLPPLLARRSGIGPCSIRFSSTRHPE